MIKKSLQAPQIGQYRMGGYAGEMIAYTIKNQLLDEATWKLFVNQFRTHPDGDTRGWRGEFWGKMMRAGSLTYRATADEALYAALTTGVEDMLTAQDEEGRFSTYAKEKEFHGWDMWARKYVLLGFLYYLEICKDEALKKRVVVAMKKHADYIVARVGKGEGQTEICNTAENWGGLNSCSILEPFVKLYKLTGEKRYLNFAEYIVSTGFCKDENILLCSLKKEKFPYQFKQVKAYEMMSCFEGLLEYYTVTGNPDHLKAVVNFTDMVLETDYTIIGSCGCTHELFDHSTVKQTEISEGVMQETCVTVTFMKLCYKLLALTGESKYAAAIERSGYNALFGAVNNENQTMKRTQGLVWYDYGAEAVAHESFPFDSYSPLALGQRGRRIGGFMVMENGRSYGCCASIGAAGTAIMGLAGIMKSENGYCVNLYNDGVFEDGVRLQVKGDPYGTSGAKINVRGGGRTFELKLRVPDWAENFSVCVNGEKAAYAVKQGYAVLKKAWGSDTVTVLYDAPVKAVFMNGKIAFTRGAIVLSRDERFGDDLTAPVKVKEANGLVKGAKKVRNEVFCSNLAVKIKTESGEITLCDYAQAGKNYDDEHCNIAAWQPTA